MLMTVLERSLKSRRGREETFGNRQRKEDVKIGELELVMLFPNDWRDISSWHS